MPVCTREELVGRLEECGLLSDEDLQQVRDSQAADESVSESDASGGPAMLLARRLVKQKKLNRWQAQALLSGVRIRLGKYTLLDQIGVGDTGTVYRARHASLDREVALKTLSRQYTNDPRIVGEFLTQARAIASLDHRNLIHVFDINQDRDRYFLVLEHVSGSDAQRIVDEHGALPLARAADIVRQAADGLACAHASGLVHGHLKPANVLLDSQSVVKIASLGAGRLADETEHAFAAPEVLAGTSAAPPADVFALGCIFYLLLTGKSPIVRSIAGRTIADAGSIAATRSDAPTLFIDLVGRMMAADPTARPDCVQVAQELGAWLKEQKSESSAGAAKVRKLPTAKPLPDTSQPAAVIAPVIVSAEPLGDEVIPAAAPVLSPQPAGVEVASASGLPISIVTTQRSATTQKSPSAPPAEANAGGASAKSAPLPAAVSALSSRRARWPLFVALGAALVVLAAVFAVGGYLLFFRSDEPTPIAATDSNAAAGPDRQSKTDAASPGDAEGDITLGASAPGSTADAGGDSPGANSTGGNALATLAEAAGATQPQTASPPSATEPPPTVPATPLPQPGQVGGADAGASTAAPPTSPDAAASPPEQATAPMPTAPPPTPPGEATAAAAAPVTPAPATPATATPTQPATEPPAAENPFRDLPLSVDLPPQAPAPSPIVWAVVHNRPEDQFFAALHGGDMAAPKPGQAFYLKPGKGGASTRDWEFYLRYSDDDETGRLIARAEIVEQNLQFTWTEQAPQEPVSLHLKNCVLHLRSQGFEHSLALRKPVVAEPLIVSFDKRPKAALVELDDPPKPEAIRVEIDVLEGEFGDYHFDPEKTFPGSRGQTSILIGKPAEPLFGLLVESDLKKRLELKQMPYFYNKLSERKVPITAASMKLAETKVVTEAERYRLQQLQLNTITDAEQRKALQEQITAVERQLAAAENTKKQFEQFKSIVEQVNNTGRIHFRVFVQTGTSQLELARSASAAPAAAN